MRGGAELVAECAVEEPGHVLFPLLHKERRVPVPDLFARRRAFQLNWNGSKTEIVGVSGERGQERARKGGE